MKKQSKVFSKLLVIAFVFCTIVLLSNVEAGQKAEKEVTLSEVSAAARATIEKYSANAEIEKIEFEYEDGKEFYEVEMEKDGKEIEFKVAPDGKFLGYEDEDDEDEDDEEDGDDDEMPYDKLPMAVKAAAEKYLGVEGDFEAEKEIEDGVAYYEVEVEKDGMEKEIKVTEEGELVEMEEEIKIDQIPADILSMVKKKYPDSEIKEAENIQSFYYEIELTKDGKEIELLISPSGKIKRVYKQEKDDD